MTGLRLADVAVVAVVALPFLVACGPRADGTTADPARLDHRAGEAAVAHSPLAPTAPTSSVATPRDTPECAAKREAVFELGARSRERHCTTDPECVAVMGPRAAEPSLNIIAHRRDAREIEAASERVLRECGASAVWDPAVSFVIVEGRCTAGHCAAAETTFHPESP